MLIFVFNCNIKHKKYYMQLCDEFILIVQVRLSNTSIAEVDI